MNKFPTKDEAEKILLEIGCSKKIIEHSKAVTELAVKIARKMVEKNLDVDLNLVEVGALLHDIGRIKTRSVLHGYYGGKIAKMLGLPESLVNIIEKHVGAGIPAEEAVKLGLPKKNFTLDTLEEKIVAYADKRIKHNKIIDFETSLNEFKKRLGENHPAIERLKCLHEEIVKLLGGDF
ncbi:HD domain-containing protein [Candidatus Bathyarchaeota archaeon]|nr:MAG: HD domain-containing protein [Candidatus Bathyarchaeota archaeon]